MVGAIDLFEADYSLLGRPVQRQVDMRCEFQIGQFSTLGDHLAPPSSPSVFGPLGDSLEIRAWACDFRADGDCGVAHLHSDYPR
jgi:hypothetical protein